MSKLSFEAVIFDLDGVITQTALVHSTAWKRMFDEYLMDRSNRFNETFKEFSHKNDYLKFVDGKPRYKGVQSFLESRDIHLDYGAPSDNPEEETICGVGNRKNIVFNDILKVEGVKVYPSTVKLIHELIEKEIHVGVASSSKNCEAVLSACELLSLMETRVDGVVSAELGLNGKPEPDIFTTASDNLGVSYDRAIVIEDAESGVAAGAKGNFGLVIGIARENNKKELILNGADIVVNDLEEISIDSIQDWFIKGLNDDNWCIKYHDYVPTKEKSRESLLAIGNGYFGNRGALEESNANPNNYPGTYVAGLYNRLISKVGDKNIENEDFVNIPNWLSTSLRIDGEEYLSLSDFEIIDIDRKLDFRSGELIRNCLVTDKKGRISKISSKRFASMNSPQNGLMSYSISPQNYSGNIELKTEIDANIINSGVERYSQLNQNHIVALSTYASDSFASVLVKTSQSEVQISIKQKVHFKIDGIFHESDNQGFQNENVAGNYCACYLKKGQSIGFEKLVEINASHQNITKKIDKDQAFNKNSKFTYADYLNKSISSWGEIWETVDIKLIGDRKSQKLLRLHLYHLMVSCSPHHHNLDAGIPARGLHGEAYRGHIFWDELYILPLYTMHFPKVTKSVLMYRYNRLAEARKYAKENGYKGAMFPWQSGSDGREETQIIHLNPLTGKWGDDYSALQRHVSLAIAYNIIRYHESAIDDEFIENFGLEMLLEICRFWVSKTIFNTANSRYEISGVMGPDEFHEKYQNSDIGGLKDNAYTNLMLIWTIKNTLQLYDSLSDNYKLNINKLLNFSNKELALWNKIKNSLYISISDEGIIEQFDGYFNLEELDWNHYHKKYGNIYRMDRILKSEGKSADAYKVAKQADTLMTFYNLDNKEVERIITSLGYDVPSELLSKNLQYYIERTSHGSTLSRVVHSHLANSIGNKQLSWDLFEKALSSDFNDLQGGTTSEGIHTGVMAGTVLIAMMSYAGINLKGDFVEINPNLPTHWKEISFNFNFRQYKYEVKINKKDINIRLTSKNISPQEIIVSNERYKLQTDEWSKIILNQ